MTHPDRVPYGTIVDPNDPDRIIDNPAEQMILERMMIMRNNEGMGYKTIADSLNSEGVSPRSGRQWWATSVRNIVNRSTQNDHGAVG